MFVKIENCKCFDMSFPRSAVSRGASENLLKIFRPKLFAFIEEFFFFLRLEARKAISFRLLLRVLSLSGAASEENKAMGPRIIIFLVDSECVVARESSAQGSRAESWSQENMQSVFARTNVNH